MDRDRIGPFPPKNGHNSWSRTRSPYMRTTGELRVCVKGPQRETGFECSGQSKGGVPLESHGDESIRRVPCSLPGVGEGSGGSFDHRDGGEASGGITGEFSLFFKEKAGRDGCSGLLMLLSEDVRPGVAAVIWWSTGQRRWPATKDERTPPQWVRRAAELSKRHSLPQNSPYEVITLPLSGGFSVLPAQRLLIQSLHSHISFSEMSSLTAPAGVAPWPLVIVARHDQKHPCLFLVCFFSSHCLHEDVNPSLRAFHPGSLLNSQRAQSVPNDRMTE